MLALVLLFSLLLVAADTRGGFAFAFFVRSGFWLTYIWGSPRGSRWGEERDANGIASAEDGAMGGVAPCGIPTLYRHT